MENQNIKVNFLLICESADFDSSGKLNIYGVFDQIRTGGFPALRKKLSIVLQLELPKGKHTQYVKFRKNNWEVRTLDVNIEKEEDSQHNVIHNITNLILPEEGDYEIEVFVDNNKILYNGYTKFSVIKE